MLTDPSIHGADAVKQPIGPFIPCFPEKNRHENGRKTDKARRVEGDTQQSNDRIEKKRETM
eukprot:1137046-Pelagomonas_calceolata.AAC.3